MVEGSCHCGAVSFRVNSSHAVPYQRCYCSICRKTSGGGGYLINTAADARTLEVRGRDSVAVYRAMVKRDGRDVRSGHERHFCRHCGSHLWAFNNRWPELVHPVAAAIDSMQVVPTSSVHMMLSSKADWVAPRIGDNDECFDEYPRESIAEWHEARGLTSK